MRFDADAEFDSDRRGEMARSLTDWYYRDGNGMLLPLEQSAFFLLVRDMSARTLPHSYNEWCQECARL